MTRLDDLQAWLALEHEAVWLYGMIGARVDNLAKPARTSYDAHRAVRDRLLLLVDEAGGTPDGPALTYGEEVIASAKQARAAASSVEERIAAACVALFGGGVDKDGRRFAMSGLRRAALAGLDWGAPVRAFPGLD
jgi:hypothetical protein